jgi:hypothetical protein
LLSDVIEAYPEVSIEIVDDHLRVSATGSRSDKVVNQILDDLIMDSSANHLDDFNNEDDIVEQYFGPVCKSLFEQDLALTNGMISKIVEHASIKIEPCGNEDRVMVLLKYPDNESASEAIDRFVHELIQRY